MGWIVAALMAFIAAIAIATIWRGYKRRERELRASHQKAVRTLDEEHNRRLKRLTREHDRTLKAAHFPLTKDLMPALDSLDEALSHFEDQDLEENEDIAEFQAGIDLARSALHDALARHGISPIEPEPGEAFDPNIHEAIARNEDPDAEPGTVRQLLRRGYEARDRVLRSAMVEVNVGPTKTQEDSDGDLESSGEVDSDDPSLEDALEDPADAEDAEDAEDFGEESGEAGEPDGGNSISSVGSVDTIAENARVSTSAP